jgi:hypothetical protein
MKGNFFLFIIRFKVHGIIAFCDMVKETVSISDPVGDKGWDTGLPDVEGSIAFAE